VRKDGAIGDAASKDVPEDLSRQLRGRVIPLIGAGYEVIGSVDAGRTLILTHLNAIAFSNLSNQPLTEASCTAYLKTPAPGGGSQFTPFLGIPVDRSPSGTFFGSMPLFIPLGAGEGLNVLCVGQPAVSQGFRVTAGGYFVPGSE